MAYATVEEAIAYLSKQLPNKPDNNELLTAILDRATSIVDECLEFGFADWGATPTVKALYPDGTGFLSLPPHKAGSVSLIGIGGGTVDPLQYTVDDKERYVVGLGVCWPRGRVDVTAIWGYGPPPPAVVEVVLELSVNIWRQKDRGLFTDTIGVDSAGVGNSGGVFGLVGTLTKIQRTIIEAVKRRYTTTNI